MLRESALWRAACIFSLGLWEKLLSEIERATEQRLREIERARAEQLDVARSWILLFTLVGTFGLWWVFYNQLRLVFMCPGCSVLLWHSS
jgi:hypothetical protein